MGTTVRQLLDALADSQGRDALDPLLHLRGLPFGTEGRPGVATLDEKKGRIARSYRGEMRDFLRDLRRKDLITLARDLIFDLRPGDWYVLPRPERFSRDELLAIFERALVKYEIPPEMERVEEEGDDDEDETVDMAAMHAAALADVGSEWSRPRYIRRLMTALGFSERERLRTARFQKVVRAVRAAGVEMCLDGSEEIIGDNDRSPGIEAKVRLRRAMNVAAGQGPEPREHTSVVVRASQAPSFREVATQTPASHYEIALLRLQLLTGVPSLEREHGSGWPREFVDAAVRGLQIEAYQHSVLVAVAQTFRRGIHDPFQIAVQLQTRIGAEQWEEVLADFERLNTGNAATAVLLEQLRRGAERGAAAAPPPPAPPPVVAAPPRAAAPAAPAPPAPAQSGGADARDLGALEDMFDDE